MVYFEKLKVNGKDDEKSDDSSDEGDSERDGTDAVKYGSCQYPVVLRLVLLVCLVVLFLFLSLEKMADFL